MNKLLLCSIIVLFSVGGCVTTTNQPNLLLADYRHAELAQNSLGGVNTAPLRLKIIDGGINISPHKETTKIEVDRNGDLAVR